MEEDIKIVKEFNLKNRYRDGGKINNAIDNILNELERLQKEFEVLDRECSRLERKEIELEKEVKDWQKAYQEEKDEQFNMLIKKCSHCGNDTPLYCETCYQELISKNAELQLEIEKMQEEIMENDLKVIGAEEYTEASMREIIEKYYTANEDCIPKQIIRDKIQLLEKELELLDKNDKHTLIENDYIISILKEILGEDQ